MTKLDVKNQFGYVMWGEEFDGLTTPPSFVVIFFFLAVGFVAGLFVGFRYEIKMYDTMESHLEFCNRHLTHMSNTMNVVADTTKKYEDAIENFEKSSIKIVSLVYEISAERGAIQSEKLN